MATPVLAHRPYESVAGTFERPDGTVLSIVRHRVDGIVTADPVSIQFRLPDGAAVAHTPHVFDAVVRPVASGVEIYQYRTDWFPMASRVDFFDGYQLKDITSSRRANSLIVHFADRWVGYLIAGGLGAFLVAFYFCLRAMPERCGWAAVRRLGFAFVGVAGFFLAYDILMFEPISSLVLAGCGAVVWALIRGIGSRRQATAG